MKILKLVKNSKLLAVLLSVLLVSLSGCSGVDPSKFQIIEFNGHSYVAYDGDNYDSGLLHDPDCELKDQKAN